MSFKHTHNLFMKNHPFCIQDILGLDLDTRLFSPVEKHWMHGEFSHSAVSERATRAFALITERNKICFF